MIRLGLLSKSLPVIALVTLLSSNVASSELIRVSAMPVEVSIGAHPSWGASFEYMPSIRIVPANETEVPAPDGVQSENDSRDRPAEFEVRTRKCPSNDHPAYGGFFEVFVRFPLSGRLVRWFRLESEEWDLFDLGSYDRFDVTVEVVRQEPLLVALRLERESSGVNTHWPEETLLLVRLVDDLPVVLALFGTAGPDGGGACGAPDNGFAPGDGLSCRALENDFEFFCLETSFRSPFERFAFSSSFLEPGHSKMDPTQRPRDLIEEFSRRLVKRVDPRGVRETLGPLGPVQCIDAWTSRRSGRRFLLLEAPVQDATFLAVSPKERKGSRFEILTIACVDLEPTTDETSEWYLDLDEPLYGLPTEYPRYELETVRTRNSAAIRIVEVIRTAKQDSTFRRLEWTGIEERPEGIVASTIVLANETPTYKRCGHVSFDPSAVRLERGGQKGILARLVMRDEISTDAPEVPWWPESLYQNPVRRVGLRWKTGAGFRVELLPGPPPPGASFGLPVVRPDGSLADRPPMENGF